MPLTVNILWHVGATLGVLGGVYIIFDLPRYGFTLKNLLWFLIALLMITYGVLVFTFL